VKVRSCVVVGAGGRLAHLDTAPPLTVRRVHAPVGTCALCLVGTAAGPLPGDDLELSVCVAASARATLMSTGATIAQAGKMAGAARTRTRVALGSQARLIADPGALVVCEGAVVDVDMQIDLAPDATLTWHELLVRGRSDGTQPGSVRLRWNVNRAGKPLLRQHVDLADPLLREWSGMTGGRRVLASSLCVAPGLAARTVVDGPFAVASPLAADAALITVLGHDAAEVGDRRSRLLSLLGLRAGGGAAVI
jgi:urease accessory protein